MKGELLVELRNEKAKTFIVEFCRIYWRINEKLTR